MIATLTILPLAQHRAGNCMLGEFMEKPTSVGGLDGRCMGQLFGGSSASVSCSVFISRATSSGAISTHAVVTGISPDALALCRRPISGFPPTRRARTSVYWCRSALGMRAWCHESGPVSCQTATAMPVPPSHPPASFPGRELPGRRTPCPRCVARTGVVA